MRPKSTDIFRMDLMFVGPANSDHQFPKVSQVEDIVNFGRSRQQLFDAIIVELN